MKKGEMLHNMIVLATNAHAGQFDKGGQPYILHPLAVMYIAHSSDEEINCMCVGHDLFEDTKVTSRDLYAAGMTQRIVTGITLLTKMPGQSAIDYEQGVMSTEDTILVKMADLTHNTDIRRLKGVTEKDHARMARYHEFYTKLNNKLRN